MFSPSRFAVPTLLLLLSASACFADSPLAAPAPMPAVPLAPVVRVEPVPSTEGTHLQVDVSNSDITAVLMGIATKGDLQIAIKPGVHVVLQSVAIKDSTPEAALQLVCKAAALGCKTKDGVWIISPSRTDTDAANKPKIIDSMAFKDVEIEPLLSMIATQFDVQIAIEGKIEGKIPYIRLQNKTPRQAVEIIAQVADLKIQETDEGTLILTVNKNH